MKAIWQSARPAEAENNWITSSQVLDHFEKDALDIKRCDIVVVNLLGATKVSLGTVAEIAWLMHPAKRSSSSWRMLAHFQYPVRIVHGN